MDYTELGFDKFLNKPKVDSEQLPDNDFDLFVENISATKLTSGISKSKDLTVDFDKGLIEKNEGETLRLKIGKFDDGKYGLRVFNSSGTLVVDQTA